MNIESYDLSETAGLPLRMPVGLLGQPTEASRPDLQVQPLWVGVLSISSEPLALALVSHEHNAGSYSINVGVALEAGLIADWYLDAQARLEALAALEPDWDGYGAPPPSPTARVHAYGLLNALLGTSLRVSAVLPTSDGVALRIEERGHRADLEFDNDGAGGVVIRRDGIAFVHAWDMDLGGDAAIGASVEDSVRRLVEAFEAL